VRHTGEFVRRFVDMIVGAFGGPGVGVGNGLGVGVGALASAPLSPRISVPPPLVRPVVLFPCMIV
jgi:hypothetical protein